VYDHYFQSTSTSAEEEPHQDDQLADTSVGENGESARDMNSSIHSIVTMTVPEDIIPVPNLTYKKSQKSTRAINPAGKTAIVTGSPYLKELRLSEENKALRDQIKVLKKALKDTNKALKKSTISRGESSRNANNDEQSGKSKSKSRKRLFKNEGKLNKMKNKKSKKSKKNNDVMNTLSSDSELEEIAELNSNNASVDVDNVPETAANTVAIA